MVPEFVYKSQLENYSTLETQNSTPKFLILTLPPLYYQDNCQRWGWNLCSQSIQEADLLQHQIPLQLSFQTWLCLISINYTRKLLLGNQTATYFVVLPIDQVQKKKRGGNKYQNQSEDIASFFQPLTILPTIREIYVSELSNCWEMISPPQQTQLLQRSTTLGKNWMSACKNVERFHTSMST